MFIEWTKDFSVDIESIDEQHQILFTIINRLHNAVLGKIELDVIGLTFQELINYTDSHFKTEEYYMDLYGYPQTQEHKKQHEYFVKEVKNLQNQLHKNQQIYTLLVDTWILLKKWLTVHIQKEDKAYSPFFKEKGIK